MNVLLTGAEGFLGTETMKQLKDSGHTVVSTDKQGSPQFKGDLASVEFARSLPDVDAVVHSAAVQYVSDDLPVFNRAGYFHHNNLLATKNLVERYSDQKTHFVYISTSMVYHQSGLDLYSPSSPKKGQGLYSESKLAAQRFVDSMPNDTATVVPCIIAGEGRGGLFTSFVKSMTKLGFVTFPGRGDHQIHMVHVTDVARLIVLVLEKRAVGTFNAASPAPLSINEWVSEIEHELELPTVRRFHLPLAPIHFTAKLLGYIPLASEQLLMLRYKHVLSIDEGLSLGWTPAWTNAQIVRETARALAKQ